MAKPKTRRATPGTGSIFRAHDRDLWGRQDHRRRPGSTRSTPRPRPAPAKLNGLIGRPPTSQPTGPVLDVSALLQEWLAATSPAGKQAPSTEARHRWAAEHLRRELGSKPVRSLSVRDVEAALDRLAVPSVEQRGLSQASLTKVLQSLSQALLFAAERDEVARNVAKAAKVPDAATKPVRRRSMSPDEALTFARCARG